MQIEIGAEQVNEWEWCLDIPAGGGDIYINQEEVSNFINILRSGNLYPFVGYYMCHDEITGIHKFLLKEMKLLY